MVSALSLRYGLSRGVEAGGRTVHPPKRLLVSLGIGDLRANSGRLCPRQEV